ncbi:MAG TPA: hypothetical protein VL021_04815 [Brumimicrobium sp.]|nr:hypothetical protein [Brumimicrobium sp.]
MKEIKVLETKLAETLENKRLAIFEKEYGYALELGEQEIRILKEIEKLKSKKDA